MPITFAELCLYGFACFRITHLLIYEDGLWEMCRKMRLYVISSDVQLLRDLLGCPYCLGVWIAGGLLLLHYVDFIGFDLLIFLFAIAGMQTFLQSFTSNE